MWKSRVIPGNSSKTPGGLRTSFYNPPKLLFKEEKHFSLLILHNLVVHLLLYIHLLISFSDGSWSLFSPQIHTFKMKNLLVEGNRVTVCLGSLYFICAVLLYDFSVKYHLY